MNIIRTCRCDRKQDGVCILVNTIILLEIESSSPSCLHLSTLGIGSILTKLVSNLLEFKFT